MQGLFLLNINNWSVHFLILAPHSTEIRTEIKIKTLRNVIVKQISSSVIYFSNFVFGMILEKNHP